MTQQAPSNPLPPILVRARDGLILHQTLYVAAKLGVADRLDGSWRSAAELARELEVNEDALYRTLRLLASQGIFEENDARCFRNNQVSNFLRTGVPGSVRSLFIFWGSDFHYPSFGHIMHSIKTGESSRTLLSGTDGFEHLRRDPEQARIFDDAMTNMSQLVGRRDRRSLRLRLMGEPHGCGWRQRHPALAYSPGPFDAARSARRPGACARPRQ